MDQKMDKNMEQLENSMDKKMEQLQNSMLFMILHIADERLPKGDIKTQENHENVEIVKTEFQNHQYSSLKDTHHQGFNLAPRKYLIPNIDTRKFDVKDHIA
jgi:hypothetical protein